MRDFITVAKFTAKEMIKRKSFLISNLIILILIVIGFNVPNLMKSFNGDGQTGTKVLVVDSQNVFGDYLNSLNNMEFNSNFTISKENISQEKIKEMINNEETDEAIIIQNNEGKIKLEYVVKSIGMGANNEIVSRVFNELYKNVKLQNSGLSSEQIEQINTPLDMEILEIKEGAISGGMLFAAMMLCIVLFYAIYFCAYQVSSSITTEKTSKIMETLVTSTSPKTIVLGKTAGIGLVGLLQVATIVIVAFVSYKMFLPQGILDGIIDISKITPTFIILTFVYFILGYILFAFLYALTGSTVSKPEDINSANSPVALLAVVGFYLAYFSMMNPASNINTFASIFPISSPFSMPFRLIGNSIPIGDVILSICVLIITIFVVASIAIKIYSSAILNYGTKLSIKDMIKIYKDKNN